MSINLAQDVGLILQNFEANEVAVPPELVDRIERIQAQLAEGMEQFSLNEKISIKWSYKKFCAPYVKWNPNNLYIIKLSSEFLIQPEDFEEESSVYQWFCRQWKQRSISEVEGRHLNGFCEFLIGGHLIDEGKKFLLYHELAHIRLGHLQKTPSSNEESQENEKEADLLAGQCKEIAKGGATCFSYLNKHVGHIPKTTHPSFLERVTYLNP